MYGEANTGVSNITLLAQRRAVAASSVPGGAGDLDLTLLLADGDGGGKVDPAFEAHIGSIGMWAEAVWCCWLPAVALRSMVTRALRTLAARDSPWAMVRGPAAAFVASAWRLGWRVLDAFTVEADAGAQLDLRRDSPAMVRAMVASAVRRWWWERIERRIPALASGTPGRGAYMQPLWRLMRAAPDEDWGAREKGALRSVVANRQWPQSRLCQAGLVTCSNCRLCVHFGFCGEHGDDPKFKGTLLHRTWLCPATRVQRERLVPQWLREEVQAKIEGDTLDATELLLYTRIGQVPRTACRPAAARCNVHLV